MSAVPEVEVVAEIERRWLVRREDIDPEVFKTPYASVRQAYIGDGTRVRIIEGIGAILTRKEGHGLVRTEHNIERVPPHIA